MVSVISISYWMLVCISVAQSSNPDLSHPLDPLKSSEITETANIIRHTYPFIGKIGNWKFNWITLKEPEKHLLLGYFLNGTQPQYNTKEIPRKSFTVLVERDENIVVEVVVNLRVKKVESWKKIRKGTQAPFRKKGKDAEQISKEDERVQERCREMGWTNMSLVTGEPWAVAYGEDKPYLVNATRPMVVYFYGMLTENDNHYAHPFDFIVIVDIALDKVLMIENLPTHSNYDASNRNGNICPKAPSNYKPQLRPSPAFRKDVNPIYMLQPEKASYKLSGHKITWQNFEMRLGYNGREGPIINHLIYQDGNERRPLFYRMAISETMVAYADPRPPFHQKLPFDMGQFTLGFSAVDHKQDNLCRGGTAAYFSVDLNSINGEPVSHPNVLCIHEQDAGILQTRVSKQKKVIRNRSQRLDITCMVNEGNYDYKFSWRFYLDGTIEFHTELHGSLHTQMLAEGVTDTGGFGSVVYPQINAQFHQHFIGLRLDPEIDGNVNTVTVVDLKSQKMGLTTQEALLQTPTEARTRISPLTGRTWDIRNPDRIHPLSKRCGGWKLVPYDGLPLFIRNDSPMYPKCAWAEYNVWVTKYNEDQLYAGGFYLDGNDLPEWLVSDPKADLTRADTVLYYVFGFTHIPRTEEFPLLSIDRFSPQAYKLH